MGINFRDFVRRGFCPPVLLSVGLLSVGLFSAGLLSVGLLSAGLLSTLNATTP